MEEAGGGGFWGATSVGYGVGDCRSKRRGWGCHLWSRRILGGIAGVGGGGLPEKEMGVGGTATETGERDLGASARARGGGQVTARVRGGGWRHHSGEGERDLGGITRAGGGGWECRRSTGKELEASSELGKWVGFKEEIESRLDVGVF
ncbi:unnamed protein product [Ilex paraguariensis]|uniref:Uncharacterized protein n=1 Tax=Ilex paraguariensis TaxID=185542 RepID=A0ABC8UCW0_9AQUA